MPIYEYQCLACGHRLEMLQKVSDAVLTDCPVCQKATLQKLVSSTSFQLKGTGWYATDFRDKGKAEKTPTEQNNSVDQDSSQASKGESHTSPHDNKKETHTSSSDTSSSNNSTAA